MKRWCDEEVSRLIVCLGDRQMKETVISRMLPRDLLTSTKLIVYKVPLPNTTLEFFTTPLPCNHVFETGSQFHWQIIKFT